MLIQINSSQRFLSGSFGRECLAGICLAVCLLSAACEKSSPDESLLAESASHGAEPAEERETLIEPFDPPTLEELDAQVTWIDKPVLDAMNVSREDQEISGPPSATVDEALALRNDSFDANATIVDALGRLPADDQAVNWESQFLRRLEGDVKSTNPLMQSSTVESEVLKYFSVYLHSYDWNMKPFGNANYVETWQTSEDGLYDKIVLRDDMVWSDGEPMTAFDVEFSYRTIMDPAIPIPAVRTGTDKLRWVQAYDERTIVYFHREASATNVWDMWLPLVPRHIYKDSIAEDPTLQTSEYHVKYEQLPVVGGPYKITRRVRGQEIVLERRDEYYMHQGQQVRGKPHFKKLLFRTILDPNTALLALRTGEVEECSMTPDQWLGQQPGDSFDKLNIKASGLQWVYFFIGWNCQSPFFNDKRVRWAMTYAYDYREMLDVIYQGLYEPCNNLFHPDSWMAPDPPLPMIQQDLGKSVELLRQAGWTDTDADGILDKEIHGEQVPFEFTILVAQRPDRIKCCALLQESLDRIGIICHVRPVEFTVLQQKNRDHEFQATMAGWGTGTDPYSNENIFATEEDRNYGVYSNPRVDELFAEGKAMLDPVKRAKIYGEIAKLLYEDQPYTWLYFRNAFYGFNRKLRGYRFSPRGPYSYGPGSDSLWKSAAAVSH